MGEKLEGESEILELSYVYGVDRELERPRAAHRRRVPRKGARRPIPFFGDVLFLSWGVAVTVSGPRRGLRLFII